MKILLLFLFCVLTMGADASPEKKKKYNLSVCALFKDEAKNIGEWIEYHRLIGVDHFYLFENGAKDGYMKVLRPYINKKVITLIPWPNYIEKQEGKDLFKWVLSTQIPAYENVLILHAKEETKWMVFLDVDEFLLPVQGTLTELLEAYQEHPGVAICSEYFDASSAGALPSRSLVIESVDITKAPQVDVVECVKKVIFKPDLCVSSTWAPYSCIFADNQEAIQLDKHIVRINRYLNRNARSFNFRRKLYVDNRTIRDGEIEDILNSGFDIEDQSREIHRFVPEVIKRLSSEK